MHALFAATECCQLSPVVSSPSLSCYIWPSGTLPGRCVLLYAVGPDRLTMLGMRCTGTWTTRTGVECHWTYEMLACLRFTVNTAKRLQLGCHRGLCTLLGVVPRQMHPIGLVAWG